MSVARIAKHRALPITLFCPIHISAQGLQNCLIFFRERVAEEGALSELAGASRYLLAEQGEDETIL